MDSLGEFLKRGREEAEISIETLAERTRIRPEILRSLEREDLENLPTDTYVRGFVKLVCRELGLEPAEGFLRYDVLKDRSSPPDEMVWSEERQVAEPGALRRALEDPDRVIRTARRGARWGVIGGGALIAVLLIFFGVRAIGSLIERFGGDDEVASGPPATADSRRPQLSSGEPAGAQIAGNADFPNPLFESPPVDDASQPLLSEENGAIGVPEETASNEPATGDEIARAEPDAGSVPSAPGDAAATTADDPPPEPKLVPAARPFSGLSEARGGGIPRPKVEFRGPAAGAGESLRLEIVALEDVHVEVLLEGEGIARQADLEAGSSKTWKARRLFLLSASDAGAIQVRLQGEDVGLLGIPGKPLDWVALRPR